MYLRIFLDKIPTVGSSTWLGSWWAGIKFLVNATNVIQEGYEKYKGKPFKVSTLYRWMVVVSGPQCVEEFRKSRDDELNFMEAAGDILEAMYTLGRDTHYNPYHVGILRARINRNLAAMHADIKDEIVMASDEILDLKGHEWKSVPALSTAQKIISRTSNRVFVGLPLCRDPDWVSLNVEFTMDVVKGATIISLFPKFIAPLVARFMTNIPASTRRAVRHLAPIVEVRRQQLDEYGTTKADQPNDLLQWLMEGSEDSQRHVNNMASRVLAINFAAIHSFTQVVYNLAANPQYVQDLRDEVEPIIKEEGWSKVSVAKMYKIDSFMKETQRMHGIGLVNMVRKAMKDVTFPDGTVIPKGAFVAMATHPMHFDNEVYDNADVFDPFRFANMRTEDSDDVKHQFPVTSPDYLVFGYGRHACPARFFAASMLNTILAHFVVSYDVKLEQNATQRPQNLQIGTSISANPTARIMIRRRVV
ncbi:cytochrome P450 [Boletus edulis BED1]|uniref:Cytochrome P450 n=1 Tax=Boletus edulis BED1 TaxID=1328754 RepID=A0AAD4C3J3_BOLED|nr:cytochrome P450 [Boletus edulis BED1]